MTFAAHSELGNICLSRVFVAARCGGVMVSALGRSPYPYLVFLRCVFVMIWIKIKWATEDNSCHGASKEPINPLWDIHWFS